ncbi:MAG: chemotaxis protein CheB [Rhodoferax sp.]|nr:chemotaxis protein CheB [Rhodoferax sp.]
MKNFPIVCVGGSAGGLDAYIRLLRNLPPDMGVAIVIVNHITMLPTQLHEVLPCALRGLRCDSWTDGQSQRILV